MTTADPLTYGNDTFTWMEGYSIHYTPVTDMLTIMALPERVPLLQNRWRLRCQPCLLRMVNNSGVVARAFRDKVTCGMVYVPTDPSEITHNGMLCRCVDCECELEVMREGV